MRITFVIRGLSLSGGTRIIAEHARMLHERGHTVTVVVAGQYSRPVTMMDRAKAFVRGCPIQKRKPSPSHLDGAPFLVHMAEEYRPVGAGDVPDADLIISSWWEVTEWVWAMPASKGVKVNFLQGYEVHPWLPADRVEAVWRLPIPKIVVSRWLGEIAEREYGDDGAILVSNGVDTDHFRFIERGPSGSCIIGGMYTGMGPSNIKRFWLAVETVRALRARGVDCRFVGFGSRAAGEGELPPGSSFEVAPTQERIAEIYASCDCWLFTSDKEGFGLPLLEAMSCGTPVVATPAGAAPELLESGGGEMVDSSDPEVLADAVQRVLELPDDQWRAMSRVARREAEKHSWSAIGDEMESALLKILEDSRSGDDPVGR